MAPSTRWSSNSGHLSSLYSCTGYSNHTFHIWLPNLEYSPHSPTLFEGTPTYFSRSSLKFKSSSYYSLCLPLPPHEINHCSSFYSHSSLYTVKTFNTEGSSYPGPNAKLVTQQVLHEITDWQIYTECLPYTGPYFKCWPYNGERLVTIPTFTRLIA